MALAAFKLLKCIGTNAATETDCDEHPTFLNADLVSLATATYKIAVPIDVASSPNYSFEIWLRSQCTGAPDNYCQNFKVWGPADQPDSGDTPGNRLTVNMGTTASGVTPTDSASSVATVAQHSNYYSQATGLSIGVEPVDNKIDAVGEKTDYIVQQLKVQDLAQQGDMQTILFMWDFEET